MAGIRNISSVSKRLLFVLSLGMYSVIISFLTSKIYLWNYHPSLILKESSSTVEQLGIVLEQPNSKLEQSEQVAIVLGRSRKVLELQNVTITKSSRKQPRGGSVKVNSYYDNRWTGENNGTFFKIPGIEIYLKSAHLDDRFNETFVRMFGVQHSSINNTETQLYCRFNMGDVDGIFIDVRVEIVPVYPPYPPGVLFYTSSYWCDIPHLASTDLVGVYTSDKKLGTYLKIVNEQLEPGEVKQNMSICVKPITGTLDVLRLVEWIEFHKISGFDHFVIYTNENNGAKNEVERVLDYYQDKGLLDIQYDRFFYSIVTHLKAKYELNDNNLGWIISQLYLTSYNDCLYRYRNKFKYILMLDYDEIIFSINPKIRIIDVIESGVARFPHMGGWSFNSAWHLDSYGPVNISQHRHLHSQVFLRRSIVNGDSDKTFSDTAYALQVTWHVTSQCKYTQGPIRENCNMFPNMYQTPDILQNIIVHHYRSSCRLAPEDCDKYSKGALIDDSPLQYGDTLNQNLKKVLKNLNIELPS